MERPWADRKLTSLSIPERVAALRAKVEHSVSLVYGSLCRCSYCSLTARLCGFERNSAICAMARMPFKSVSFGRDGAARVRSSWSNFECRVHGCVLLTGAELCLHRGDVSRTGRLRAPLYYIC